jgi:hypothetical protein
MTPCDHASKGQSGKSASEQVSVWRSRPACHPQGNKIDVFGTQDEKFVCGNEERVLLMEIVRYKLTLLETRQQISPKMY